MKKAFVVVLIFVLLALGIFYIGRQEEAPSDKPIVKIGAILPLSGELAHLGRSIQKALKLTLDQMSEKGLKYEYRFIFEDNAGEPRRAATGVMKLINVDKAQAIFSIFNNLTIPVASFATPRQVLTLTCSWEDKALETPLTFNVFARISIQADLMAAELKRRGIKRVGLFLDERAERVRKELERSLATAGIEIAATTNAITGTRDFRIAIMKMEQAKPEIYILAADEPIPFLFMKQLHELTGRRDVTAIGTFPLFSPERRPIAEGLWFVSNAVEGTAAFMDAYQAQTGEEAQGCAGPQAAGLQILIDAYEQVAPPPGQAVPTTEQVADYIRQHTHNIQTSAGEVSVAPDSLIEVMPKVRMIKNNRVVDAE